MDILASSSILEAMDRSYTMRFMESERKYSGGDKSVDLKNHSMGPRCPIQLF